MRTELWIGIPDVPELVVQEDPETKNIIITLPPGSWVFSALVNTEEMHQLREDPGPCAPNIDAICDDYREPSISRIQRALNEHYERGGDRMIYGIPEAKVIADSISQDGHRLTTIEAKIHRFILAELNTHRMFSRNSASSRAIPARKIRQMVVDDPAMPVWWGKNQAGMQAPEELIGLQKEDAINGWLKARDTAVLYHMELESIGLHKQITNRILEPWLWHRVIISATEWDNFFWQRYHKHAQPEMRAAAEFIHKVYSESTPVLRVKPTDTSIIGNVVGIKRAWHLPYITEVERESLLTLSELRAISVGRCCRVSYLNHDGVRDPEADIALYDKLISQFPGHWSPLEHVAVVTDAVDQTTRNFRGWCQLRGLVEPPVPKFKKG